MYGYCTERSCMLITSSPRLCYSIILFYSKSKVNIDQLFQNQTCINCANHFSIESHIIFYFWTVKYWKNNFVWGNFQSSTCLFIVITQVLVFQHSIKIHSIIGHGNFGSVLKGEYTKPNGEKIPVAVKKLKSEEMNNPQVSLYKLCQNNHEN